MTEKLLVTAREAAEMLAVSEHQVRLLVAKSLLDRRFIGQGRREYRITVESIRAYVEALPREAVGESA